MGYDMSFRMECYYPNIGWIDTTSYVINPHHNGNKSLPKYLPKKWFGRNYPAYAILANVCNNYKLVPICELKGCPADVSPSVKQALENEAFCKEDVSYITLDDIVEYVEENPLVYIDGKETETKKILKDYIDELQEQKKWHLRYDEDLTHIRMVFWFN